MATKAQPRAAMSTPEKSPAEASSVQAPKQPPEFNEQTSTVCADDIPNFANSILQRLCTRQDDHHSGYTLGYDCFRYLRISRYSWLAQALIF